MVKNKQLEFYAFMYDWNEKEIVKTNVLNERMIESIKKLIKRKKPSNMSELEEIIRGSLFAQYGSRREYEMIVGDLIDTDIDDFFKVDIYMQVLPNIKLITKYVNENFNFVKE